MNLFSGNELPIVIDVEASGFGRGSYPIEIGVAMPDEQAYCGLIKPEPGWNHWDKKAEALHGINQSILLEHGKGARLVAEQLNRLLQGKTAYSDAWGNDMAWISLLFDQVELRQQFTVDALSKLLSDKQKVLWEQTKNQVLVEMKLKRHRASSDARILQQTFLQTIKCQN